MQRKGEYSTWPMWRFCKAAAPEEHTPFHFLLFHPFHANPLLSIPPSLSESICLNQSHRRRSWIMYQPGFVNRFVNNAFWKEKKRKEEERREIKRDRERERRREGELGRRVLKEEHLGGCGVRHCFGQALSTGDTPVPSPPPSAKACIRPIRSSPRFSHTTCLHHSSPHTHPSADRTNRRHKPP